SKVNRERPNRPDPQSVQCRNQSVRKVAIGNLRPRPAGKLVSTQIVILCRCGSSLANPLCRAGQRKPGNTKRTRNKCAAFHLVSLTAQRILSETNSQGKQRRVPH